MSPNTCFFLRLFHFIGKQIDDECAKTKFMEADNYWVVY